MDSLAAAPNNVQPKYLLSESTVAKLSMSFVTSTPFVAGRNLNVKPRTCGKRPARCGVEPLTPRERGKLRYEAVRRMRIGEMAQYTVTAPESDDSAAHIIWAQSCSTPISDLLRKYQIVKVKVRGAGKRRRAERLGTVIAKQVNAQIAQSLGHTVLLYIPAPDVAPFEFKV